MRFDRFHFFFLIQEVLKSIDVEVQETGSLRYLISTKVGSGPQVLADSSLIENPLHLLNSEGQPKDS